MKLKNVWKEQINSTTAKTYSNQITVVAFQSVKLAQASFLLIKNICGRPWAFLGVLGISGHLLVFLG